MPVHRNHRYIHYWSSLPLLIALLLLLSACTVENPQVDNLETVEEATAEAIEATAVEELETEEVDVEEVEVDVDEAEAADVAVETDGTTPALAMGMLTGSALLDHDFTNINGEVSGEIEDVLIDLTSGRLLFANLEYGGFLDIGDKELPVPLSAFQQTDGELILNFEESRLEALPDLGSNWPDLTDTAWDDDVVSFWREIGFDPGFDFENNTSIVIWLSSLLQTPITDMGQGDGELDNLLINMEQGRIEYVILRYGPLLGEELVAVPFNAFNTQVFNRDSQIGLDLDTELLSSAPRFTSEELEDEGIYSTRYDENNQFWAEQGYELEE